MAHAEHNIAKVAIVILNWNGRDDTLACLTTVDRLDYPNFIVLVVDNGSTDDSVVAIRAAFPGVEVVETGANLGFSGGNNVGVKRALELDANYLLLLNNDTEVDGRLLKAFVAAAKRFPNAGAFGGKIYFFQDPLRIWYAGAKWDPETASFVQIGEGIQDDDRSFSAVCEIDYACGCAFFVSAERIREIGLLDDAFFLYFEETDWCYRARKAGYPSMFVPEAKLWHKVSVSFGGEGSPLQLYFLTRNRLLWARKHGSPQQRRDVHRATRRRLAQRLGAPLAGRDMASPRSLKTWWWSVREAFADPHNRAFLLGVRDFWRGRFGDCPPVVRELTALAGARARARARQASLRAASTTTR